MPLLTVKECPPAVQVQEPTLQASALQCVSDAQEKGYVLRYRGDHNTEEGKETQGTCVKKMRKAHGMRCQVHCIRDDDF